MTDKVVVTQADREAAARFVIDCDGAGKRAGHHKAYLRGEGDESVLVRTLARHRTDALSRLEAEKRELVEALRPFAEGFAKRRAVYARRYKDRQLGEQNFDNMPDAWPMDRLTFMMRDFRRARSTLSKITGDQP